MIRYFGNHIQLFSRESEEVLAWRCIHTGRQPTLEESIAVHPTHAKIKGVWYEVLRPSQYRPLRGPDGYYRYLYLQVNLMTGHYYIGKSNKQRWSEVRSYKGSGRRFINEYRKYKDFFRLYVFAVCKTAQETEDLESYIVDEELLSDPNCLNLVCGGGGTGDHQTTEEELAARRARGRAYAQAHPEIGQQLTANMKAYYAEHPEEIERRNESIRAKMSGDEYKQMTRERIKAWREAHPEEYALAREKSRQAIRSPEVKARQAESRKRWRQEHPEEYEAWQTKLKASRQSDEAKAKRRASLRAWAEAHPEEAVANARRRALASAAKNSRPIEMLDQQTGQVLMRFANQREAAKWLWNQRKTSCKNPAASIGCVCNKKEIPGHGVRKQAFGYGWRYADR